MVRQSSLRHFWVTGAKRWAPSEDGSGSMCPKTDEERERKSTVGRPEEVLSSPLPCLHCHFPAELKLSSPLSLHPLLSCQSHFASSIWFLNDPLAWLYTCWYLSSASSFGSWLADQMHPETLKKDRWVLCHKVRHDTNTHKHNYAVWLQSGTTFGLHRPHRLWGSLLYYIYNFTVLFFFRLVPFWERSWKGAHVSCTYTGPNKQVRTFSSSSLEPIDTWFLGAVLLHN